MSCLCPHCGFSLKADEPLELGEFLLDPRGLVHFRGQRVRLSKQEALLLYAVAAARGRPLHRDVIWGRISNSETLYQRELITGVLTQIKHRLADAAVPFPLETLRGTGNLRWHLQSPE